MKGDLQILVNTLRLAVGLRVETRGEVCCGHQRVQMEQEEMNALKSCVMVGHKNHSLMKETVRWIPEWQVKIDH